jgi:hypothetical protein
MIMDAVKCIADFPQNRDIFIEILLQKSPLFQKSKLRTFDVCGNQKFLILYKMQGRTINTV